MKNINKYFMSVLLLSAIINVTNVAAEIKVVETSVELKSALLSIAPGDVIELEPGIYTTETTSGTFPTGDGDTVTRGWYFRADVNGTETNPITLRSANSADPAILAGSGWEDSGYGLYVTGDYWVVEDIKITQVAKGLMIANSNFSKINDVEIFDIGQEALHVLDGSSFTIIDSVNIHNVGIRNDGFGEGIYVGSDNSVWWEGNGSTTGENGLYYRREVVGTHIKNCTVGPNVTAEPFDIKEGAYGTIVEGCTIYGSGISGNNFADSHIDIKGYETIVKNNVFYQNENSNINRAIMIVPRINAGVDAQYTAHDNYIHNNHFNLNEDVEMVVANSGSVDTYAWENTRTPEDGNFYNSRVTEEIPDGYFADTSYYINASSIGNGVVVPDGTIQVSEGSGQSFAFVPDENYKIGDVQINGESVGLVDYYEFIDVSSNQSVSVSFVSDQDLAEYDVNVSAGENGAIFPSGSFQLSEGSSQTFTITPDDGYQISSIVVNGTVIVNTINYTIENIQSDTDIVVSFSESSDDGINPGDYETVSVPHIYDGAGHFKWKTAEMPSRVHSWNLESLTLNGLDITNDWQGPSDIPEKINGYYHFEYIGNFAWSHIEIE